MRAKYGELAHLLDDPYLQPYRGVVHRRRESRNARCRELIGDSGSLVEFASGHLHFGLHRDDNGWVFREWAPNATSIHLVGDFNDWTPSEGWALHPLGEHGEWELRLPPDDLSHGDLYKLHMEWPGGGGERLPSYVRRTVQDPHSHIFAAQVWEPPHRYEWEHADFERPDESPRIYECHVGMALEEERVGSFLEFRDRVLPRIVAAGYNTVQFMAIAEHPYYGSFGYHVSNFFAVSSRFGTPDEFKALVDAAHGCGLTVTMDLVHSHAVNNFSEGLALFDGTPYQYFHDGPRGHHEAWGSRCFDYGKTQVVHFLLSNCRYWIDEFKVDGFRFDGVTSMLYLHHGLGPAFDSYDRYFDDSVDEDAYVYLALANELIHDLRPDAMTIAEDVSGMPGLGARPEEGGCGFDYRMAMGVTDHWYRLMRDHRDENWSMSGLWHELTNRRADERTISYVECHDQAIVGGKTVIFQLADAAMYNSMRVDQQSLEMDRAIALHKMMRLATLATAGHGYLNFMGNEFGHPEWVDFPREGNNWSYHYARRLWHLREDPELKYRFLADFDAAIMALFRNRSLLEAGRPRRLVIHDADHLLAFERGGAFFFFNFDSTRSFTDYDIEAPPGGYRLILDSDDALFGGYARLEAGQVYKTQRVRRGNTLAHCLRLYLPARTVLVLERVGS